MDISEKGIMFLADKKTRFGRWVSGEITFYDGQTIGIEGKVVWKHENDIGMFLNVKSIPYSKILSEQRFFARFESEDDSSGEQERTDYGFRNRGRRGMTIEAGCDDYIPKPIDPDEILAKIEKWAKKG